MSLKVKRHLGHLLLCGIVLILASGGCSDELIDGFRAGVEAGTNSGISALVSELISTASEDLLGIESSSSSGGVAP